MPINAIFGWLIRKRISQIDMIRNNPLVVQSAVFNTLIQSAENTEWGLKHNYSKIETYEQFKSAVSLQDYEDVKPYIERAIAGEENLLWPGKTNWFAKSSGTTSDRSKFIPVTKDSLEGCHYKGGKDLLALYYENYPDANLYAGKHLVIGGSSVLNDSGDDSYTGDLSAIIVRNLPWWAEIKRTPSREIALMSDWEPKIELMAQETKDEDVCILTGVPSWTLVLAHRILEITGKKNLKEVWPNLELFMHGGVNFEPYRAEFNKIIPDGSMHYVESYNASEGIFGMQDVIGEKDLLLMLDYGIFYEFIPMHQYAGVESKTVISLEDVELDVNYAMVISTNGGLWRYILGDTVQFSNLAPYRFKITGRTKSFINAFGEELVVDNAEQAIAFACEQTDSQIIDYTASPIYMKFAIDGNKGQHEWLIEFLNPPADLEVFTQKLDSKLREINSDYDAKRCKDIALLGPKIVLVPKGTFNVWLKSKGKLGGQHKVPRLSNNREFVEQILGLI
ncbi:MAG: GH3 auxin-responsive promoter family protein [Crocinitomicaceae bacterium]|nr:GH3 auxin-responsive promoter family protein [Crocinitomicaceae bacterium]